jgi:hypothetical protein
VEALDVDAFVRALGGGVDLGDRHLWWRIAIRQRLRLPHQPSTIVRKKPPHRSRSLHRTVYYAMACLLWLACFGVCSSGGTGVIRLRIAVIRKLMQRATNPAFQPKKGS